MLLSEAIINELAIHLRLPVRQYVHPDCIQLRFGYWKFVSLQMIQDILGSAYTVEPHYDFDDDAGPIWPCLVKPV